MKTRIALPLAGLAAAIALVAFAVAALHRPAQSTIRLGGGPVAARRDIQPAEPQFGDPVVATIEVVVDQRRVDPGSVRIDERFTPYAVTASARSIRETGGVSILRVVDRLDCLDPACLPKGAAATFRFPRLRVAYPGGVLVAAWPPLRVHPRAQPADLLHPVLRVEPPQAHVTYRVPPHLTGWALLALALALALGGLALFVWALLPWLRFARRRHGTSLERILDELTNGSTSGDGGRRRTLEQLARELEPLDETLSFESHVLAWAPHEPEPAAISDLAQRVRMVVNR